MRFRPGWPSHLRRVGFAAGADTTGWQEAARLLLTALWIVSLSFWCYYQVLWLFSQDQLWKTALSSASIQLNAMRPIWLLSFFAALAFALAWHAFSYRIYPAVRRGLDDGSDAHVKIQAYGGLCIGIALYSFHYRLLPIHVWFNDGMDLQTEPVAAFFSTPWDVTVDWPPFLGLHLLVALLAAGFLGVRTWGLLPRRRGTRLRFAGLVALLVAAALAGPGFGLPRFGSLVVSPVVRDLERASPVVRGLLLGDETHAAEAESLLNTYFVTHDSNGNPLTWWQVRTDGFEMWDELDRREHEYAACELCRLPRTRIWTLSGLPLRLHADRPNDTGPSLIVEVPRHPDTARLYQPGRPGSFRRVPLEHLGAEIGEADWLVLKIDTLVRMEVVHPVLRALRDAGTRRVDLAVVPHFVGRLADSAPLLEYGSSTDAVPYEARRHRRPGYIVIQKYVPPDGFVDPRPRCDLVGRSGDDHFWQDYVLEAEGALPESVSVECRPEQKYGEFVGALQGVWSSGVRTIAIVRTDPESSTVE